MADIFDRMLSRYNTITKNDEHNAIHEVMQQVCLAGLYRGHFFDKAAFYGGTCLRIFHGSQRFSEDMDFSLLEKDQEFVLENYFDVIQSEFTALGRKVEISKKKKTKYSQVESAFLKDTTETYNIQFRTEPTIKIKLEVDTDPPQKFNTEDRLLLLPFSFMTRCFTLPDLFAGKMHAFLFRGWRDRVKGRDWYDFEWYIRNNIPLDFNHFLERTYQSEKEKKGTITKEHFYELLKNKIHQTDIEMVKRDVRPFIKDPSVMDIWSSDYFSQLADMLRFDNEQ